jgi:hypothetical protein
MRQPKAQPLNKPRRGRPSNPDRPQAWLEHIRAANAPPVDDPRICPPALPGQRALLRLPRQLTDDHERRIRDRDLRGQDATKAEAVAFAVERGMSKSFGNWLARMNRLALAVRDAEGEDLVPQDILDVKRADALRLTRLTRQVHLGMPAIGSAR